MNSELIRNETQGLADKIFLNSAGASLMPRRVMKTMTDYLSLEEKLGGYEAAARHTEEINNFYAETATLLHCKPSNIAFATSATDAYAKALSGISFSQGDVIITTNDDYVSNQIAFLSLEKRHQVEVIRMKNLSDHELDLENLEELITLKNPKLIAVTHIPTNSGLIQNVEGVGRICRKYNILYLVDACQSVGQMPVNVQEIGCDFLTATGRKFLRGPRGTGFLFVSDRVLEQDIAPLFLDMKGAVWTGFNEFEAGHTAKRFELWEISYASLLGLAEAVCYANRIGPEEIEKKNKKLSENLRQSLQNKGFRILDHGNRLSSIVTFCNRDGNIENTVKKLRENDIYFSVSQKSGALIDFTSKNTDAAIRFSPHYFNTHEEIEEVIRILS